MQKLVLINKYMIKAITNIFPLSSHSTAKRKKKGLFSRKAEHRRKEKPIKKKKRKNKKNMRKQKRK